MMQLHAIGKAAQTLSSAAPKLAKLKKACQDLEAVFLKDLMTVMGKSIPKSSFGNAPGAAIYEDMFNQSVAESASKSGTFGMAKVLYREMAPRVLREAEDDAKRNGQPPLQTSTTLDIKG